MKRALLILALVNLLRFAFSFAYELFPQEAYYFFYGQHLALSYFDHPPVLAWWLRLFGELFGPTEFAIRFASFSMTLLTQLSFVLLAQRFLPRGRVWTGALLFATTVLVSVNALSSTPDVPLMLFWTLSLLLLERALFGGQRWAWVAAGVCMGLAFDSKYTAIFLQGGLLLFLLASRRHRPLLRTPWPYLAVLVAHLTMLPVYVWNAQHGFASFLFQTSGRAGSVGGIKLRYFLGLLGTQTFLLLPPLLVAVAWLGARRWRLLLGVRRRSQEKTLFLLSFFAPLFGLFVALSFFALVKPNWLMPTYVTGVLLAARWVPRRLVRWNYGLSALVHAVVAVELAFGPVPVSGDDVWYGWRELSQKVGALHAANPHAFVFSADQYKTSAELTFYLRDKIYGPNVIGERALQFDYLGDDLSTLAGRDALFIDSMARPDAALPAATRERLTAHFEHFRELAPITTQGRGRLTRHFRVVECKGYRPRPPLVAGE